MRLQIPSDRGAASSENYASAVQLEISHAEHVIKRTNTDFDRLMTTLREASESRKPVIPAPSGRWGKPWPDMRCAPAGERRYALIAGNSKIVFG